jgi:putative OPT family oligopeptide transporter
MKKNRIPEFTLRAVTLGIVLALLMGAANTYLGLYAGMTVSASIPAAVLSMSILRGILKRGSILENNITQTIASAGEALAAGIIFTIPALLIIKEWQEINYWITTLVGLLGGMVGVLFMIPFRKSLIKERKELKYPEGVACAEVLKAGEKKEGKDVGIGVGVGMGFKFIIAGIRVIKDTIEGGIRIGKTGMYGGIDISPALIGVGYIIGFNIALLVFIGGIIGWGVGIPFYGLIYGIENKNIVEGFYQIWSAKIRYMGVGAMVVGGIYSLWNVREAIVKGVKGIVKPKLGEKDFGGKGYKILITATMIGVFSLYIWTTKEITTGFLLGVLMLILAFFFVGVSSYIVGLVGSSNNPVSGMTIITLMISCGIIFCLTLPSEVAIISSLIIAGVVCSAACIAGDISQDLKTGVIVGATPKLQQISQIIGVIGVAFILAPILTLLHKGYGIGTREGLTAPQASLFASIVNGMFNQKGALPWNMVIIGGGVGIGLILLDKLLSLRGSNFRVYVMPTAVGIYLPFKLGTTILIGGIINLVSKKHKKGTLLGSGLIAGEAIMGIILASLLIKKIPLPIVILENNFITLFFLVGLIFWLILSGKKEDK